MKLQPATRGLLLSIALAATVWAAFDDGPAEAGKKTTPVGPVAVHPAPKATDRLAASGDVPSLNADRPEAAEPQTDPFRTTTWYVPPPPPPPQQPAPPAPPPFPWSYLGRFEDGKQMAVLLCRQDDSKVLRVGDTIDGTWRMSAIGDREIEFIYLPLNMTHILPIGGKN